MGEEEPVSGKRPYTNLSDNTCMINRKAFEERIKQMDNIFTQIYLYIYILKT